jgi:hypothetical protein
VSMPVAYSRARSPLTCRPAIPVLQINEAGGLNVRTNDPLGHRLTRLEER